MGQGVSRHTSALFRSTPAPGITGSETRYALKTRDFHIVRREL
jgi:hypothetical protein